MTNTIKEKGREKADRSPHSPYESMPAVWFFIPDERCKEDGKEAKEGQWVEFDQRPARYTVKALIAAMPDHWDVSEQKGGGHTIDFYLTKGSARYIKHHRQVSCCGYDSANDYMQHRLGMKMDYIDKSWYSDHHLVESAGLPAEHTITVISDLVKPYGIGVSRVWLRQGRNLLDEQYAWIEALGCNPMALMDRTTTNQQYLELVCGGPEHLTPENPLVQKMLEEVRGYRFEFREELPADSYIHYHSVFDNPDAHPSAVGGGHASYRSPRNRTNDWNMALQLDFLTNIQYHKTPPEHAYKAAYALKLDVWECLNADGEPLKKFKKDPWKDYQQNNKDHKQWQKENEQSRPNGKSSGHLVGRGWNNPAYPMGHSSYEEDFDPADWGFDPSNRNGHLQTEMFE